MLLLTMLIIFFSSLISCPCVRKVCACLPMLKISAVTELPEQLGTAIQSYFPFVVPLYTSLLGAIY